KLIEFALVSEPRGTVKVWAPIVKRAVVLFAAVAAGRNFKRAATCGREPACCCRICRPASVGTPLIELPEPSCRSVHRWYGPKKKVLSLMMGPPIVPPYWFSLRRGASLKPAALSTLLRALTTLLLLNSKAEPWKRFPPDFVRMLTTEPAARPYSAENWFVTRRISCTTSGLLIGCCDPDTLGSLLSWPSSMKLFERSRIPLTEKFVS